jgi:ribonuclease HII
MSPQYQGEIGQVGASSALRSVESSGRTGKVAPMVLDAPGVMETRLSEAGFKLVAGVDEVGRGALAGPLVAAAVILPEDTTIPGLRDSKLCTRRQRERLARVIRETAVAFSIVRVQHDRIDRIGLQRCNLDALRRALKGLSVAPEYVLLDGFKLRRLSVSALAVKKADAVSKNVAAASIVAKVHRDAAMRRYHRRWPVYGFAENVGYGTSDHWSALEAFGPCPIHRRSFYGVMGFPDDEAVSNSGKARNWVDQPGADGEPVIDEEST